MFTYKNFVSRNLGYISEPTQDKISQASLVIAGCGIGSQVADACVRLGFQKFILIDGDMIDVHNLNRQFFFADQIGKNKAQALKENILRTNPNAQVEAFDSFLNNENSHELLSKGDYIIDTIDFLDLEAIVTLHDWANKNHRTILSSFSVGFGAALVVFPPRNGPSWIRDVFNLSHGELRRDLSYSEKYIELFSKMAKDIDPQVLQIMEEVFLKMKDGEACPAPQISVGAHEVAALCSAALVEVIQGGGIKTAPFITITNLRDLLVKSNLSLV